MRKKLIVVTAAAVAAVALLAGCSGGSGNTATDQNQAQTNQQLDVFNKTQPIPANNWSQYRQTVIDVEQAEIHGVATTTFFYNLGSGVPVKSCPSIGFPVASTSQLTNPTQVDYNSESYGGNVTIDQAEPNGVYTGSSTGTYVVCVGADGSKRIDYWEGNVETEGGSAHFDAKSGQIVDDGGSTVVTKTK